MAEKEDYIDPILFEHGFFKNRTEYEAMVKRIAHAILSGEVPPVKQVSELDEEDWTHDKRTGWKVLDKVISLKTDDIEGLLAGDRGTILDFEEDGVLVEFNIKNNSECTVLVIDRENLKNEADGRNHSVK